MPDLALFEKIAMREQNYTEIALDNLSTLLLREMDRLELTNTSMSVHCDLAHRSFCRLLYKETKNPSMSAIISICENTNISYMDIFSFSKWNNL